VTFDAWLDDGRNDLCGDLREARLADLEDDLFFPDPLFSISVLSLKSATEFISNPESHASRNGTPLDRRFDRDREPRYGVNRERSRIRIGEPMRE
jgi:hypothetical protein